MAKIEEAGVAVNSVEDKAPFQAAMAPVYEAFLKQNPDLAELVDLFRNAQ